jgi:HEAT repeat protein
MPVGDITGAGAPTGITVIEGDELGSQYRGMLLSADAGRNIIFGYHPKIDRSGYALGKRENFISSLDNSNEGYVWNDSTLKQQKNKWFRPSDVTVGTDGAIYVADWYDPVVGGHLMQDSTGFGRIYRISRKDRQMTSPAIDLSTVDGQIQALKNPAINVRYAAFQKLKNANAVDAVKKLLEDSNPYVQARAVWLLPVDELEKVLSDKNELLRATAYRALRQKVSDIVPYAEKMITDPSKFVQREIAVSLTDIPYERKKSILLKLISSCDDKWMLQTIGTALKGNEEKVFPEIKKAYPGKANEFAWLLHPPDAIADLEHEASDNAASTSERLQALTGLGFVNDKRTIPVFKKLMSSSDSLVAKNAKYWLGFRSPSSVVAESSAPPAAIGNSSSKTYVISDILKLKQNATSGATIFSTIAVFVIKHKTTARMLALILRLLRKSLMTNNY